MVYIMVRNLHLTNRKRQTPYKKNKTSRWDRSFTCKEIVVVTKKSLSCLTSFYTLGYIHGWVKGADHHFEIIEIFS
jgi:hypothetical protein